MNIHLDMTILLSIPAQVSTQNHFPVFRISSNIACMFVCTIILCILVFAFVPSLKSDFEIRTQFTRNLVTFGSCSSFFFCWYSWEEFCLCHYLLFIFLLRKVSNSIYFCLFGLSYYTPVWYFLNASRQCFDIELCGCSCFCFTQKNVTPCFRSKSFLPRKHGTDIHRKDNLIHAKC